MDKINFTLCNSVSVPFNFLLYTNNIYENIYLGKTLFPNYNFSKDGLLPYESFKYQFNSLWNEVVMLYRDVEPNSATSYSKVETVVKETYPLLFEISTSGNERFKEVWKTFIGWWYYQPFGGISVLDAISGSVIPVIWDRVYKILDTKGTVYPEIKYDIVTMFERPPAEMNCDLGIFHLEPLDSFIPVVDYEGIVNRVVSNIEKTSLT